MCHEVFGMEFRESKKEVFALERRVGTKRELIETFLISVQKCCWDLCELR